MKKILAAILAAAAVMGVGAYAKTIQVTIDSADVFTSDEYIIKDTLQAAAYIENDITMVPLRFITEKLGAQVEWNHDTKEITITKADETVTLQIGNVNAVSVSGGEATTSELLAPPVIVNDITLVPLRFVSENMGATVEYIEPTRQVLITDDEPAVVVGSIPVSKDMFRTYYLANLDYAYYFGEEELAEKSFNDVVTAFAIRNSWEVIDPDTSLSEDSQAVISGMTDDDFAIGGVLRANYVKLCQTLDITDRAYTMLSTATSEEDMDAVYKSSYVRAKHILLSTVDSETGESLSASEKAKVKAQAEAVLKKAKGGADFDELIKEYGEDPGMEYAADGYVFTTGEMVEEFEKAAFELKENEISNLVETAYGYHIIKKLALPEMPEEVKAQIGHAAASDMINYIISSTPLTDNMSVEELTEYMLASSVG
ncbi:MAG: peptidylprolyl isomerase [Clostridia bacterium]|nr:peptidylprolyl isomerase [Clostridia bacterium]